MTALMIGDLGSYFNPNNVMLFLEKRKQKMSILFMNLCSLFID